MKYIGTFKVMEKAIIKLNSVGTLNMSALIS